MSSSRSSAAAECVEVEPSDRRLEILSAAHDAVDEADGLRVTFDVPAEKTSTQQIYNHLSPFKRAGWKVAVWSVSSNTTRVSLDGRDSRKECGSSSRS